MTEHVQALCGHTVKVIAIGPIVRTIRECPDCIERRLVDAGEIEELDLEEFEETNNQ